MRPPGTGRTLLQQHPLMVVHDGSGMSADDAAWAEMAETAERNLRLPGLSEACASRMRRMSVSCRDAAGLPQQQSPLESRTA